ncbi:TPA: hypothetical protein K8L94_002055, partial [Clostridium perfringens]|nr:hypothetical protein [Clostridium perfringens]HBI7168782.1 hypothetical protein [Clostridium perfringens]
MKYALDINDFYLRKVLIEKLKKAGNLTIDCFNEECCLGESFFKKVLLSNNAKADIFIRITKSIGEDKRIEILGDDQILRRVVSLNLEDIVYYIGLSHISIKSGKGLYLVKNLNSLCLI